MGMAASQARYLALLARKSNCEYEGQQINQSRLALSNQSADLFNQMMGLIVPKSPSKTDFTVQKYQFTDGQYTYTMDKWNKLTEADSDGYNYAITYHYESEGYTGFQKYKLNPQVQFSGAVPTKSTDASEEVRKIQEVLSNKEKLDKITKEKEDEYNSVKAKAKNLGTYEDTSTITKIQNVDHNEDETVYTVKYKPDTTEKQYTLTAYDSLSDSKKELLKDAVDKLIEFGVDESLLDITKLYYCEDTAAGTDFFAFKSDLDNKSATILPLYHITYDAPRGANYVSITQEDQLLKDAESAYRTAKADSDAAQSDLDKCDIPIRSGNTKLTPLGSLNDNQLAAIVQILADMKEDNIETNLTKCFSTMQEQYTADTYIGGIYTFDLAGSTYYTTYYDLYNSIINGTGVNHIDDQEKLPYYGAKDGKTPVTKTTRALIDRDQSGRFISMTMENDSYVYDLKATSETDEMAYEDAMNEYNYQKMLYDKNVSDINAKTSIIQKQDQQLELRLKQLDTEQNALSTEIEAVSKVVKDNIEKSFKTFSG